MDILDGSHGVERHTGRGNNRTARFHGYPRGGNATLGAVPSHFRGEHGGEVARGGRNRIRTGITHPVAAPQIYFRDNGSQLTCHPSPQVKDGACRRHKSIRRHDLGTDMRMQSHQAQPRIGANTPNSLPGGATGKRQPEFLVLMSGSNEIVAARVNTGSYPHHDGSYLPAPRSCGRHHLHFGQRINHEVSNLVVQCQLNFRRGFIISVQSELFPACSGRQGDAQLTFGAGIQVETFLQHPPGHAHAGKSLAGVVDIRSCQLRKSLAHGTHPGGSPRASISFVQDVERGAELRGQLTYRAAAHLKIARNAAHRGRPQPGSRAIRDGRG